MCELIRKIERKFTKIGEKLSRAKNDRVVKHFKFCPIIRHF